MLERKSSSGVSKEEEKAIENIAITVYSGMFDLSLYAGEDDRQLTVLLALLAASDTVSWYLLST